MGFEISSNKFFELASDMKNFSKHFQNFVPITHQLEKHINFNEKYRERINKNLEKTTQNHISLNSETNNIRKFLIDYKVEINDQFNLMKTKVEQAHSEIEATRRYASKIYNKSKFLRESGDYN